MNPLQETVRTTGRRKSEELLNANLKAAITTKAPNRRKGQLKHAAISHLRHLQMSPKKVRSFFQHETVIYAA